MKARRSFYGAALGAAGAISYLIATGSWVLAAVLACIPMLLAFVLIGRLRPMPAVFFAAVLFGLLPAAPGLSTASGLAGVPLQGPLVALWFVAVLSRVCIPKHSGILLGLSLTAVGGIGAWFSHDPVVVRSWVGAVVVPLLMFVGLQLVDVRDLRAARTAVRTALFTTVGLHVFYFAAVGGPTSILHPSFVFTQHTNTIFWGEVGSRVLGNPNNASVVFCAAFAWAVAERVLKAPGRFSLAFLALSALALWSTGSRGALLTAGLTVLLASAWSGGVARRFFTVTAAAAGIAAAAVYWMATFDPYSQGTLTSLISRLNTRVVSFPYVFDTPWGTGPGTTAQTLRYTLYNVFWADSVGATSHDMFVNWGVAMGWLGLSLLLGALVVALSRSRSGFGLLSLLPLVGYLLAGTSAGIDILTPTNPAWAVLLWLLIGLAWRGGIVSPPPSHSPPHATARESVSIHGRGKVHTDGQVRSSLVAK